MAVLAACGNNKEAASSGDKKEITVGFGVGTYEEQFRQSILPILEGKGYTVDIKNLLAEYAGQPGDEGRLD
ncbi:hypothetical protein ACFTAO_38735 [Paenibacillus rhizoplanae]